MNPTSPNPPPPPGADAGVQDALPAGTRFFELEVLRVLGVGGFGIVYLARDHSLERDVALKEYMPAALASRAQGSQVTVRSGSFAETYAVGLRSFVNEARLLARFDHPSLVKVYRFWEDNGTAYMVMPYYVGRTLRQVRQGMVVPPGEAACRRVLDGLLSALETLHREGVFHRDIAPDNILLGDDGLPVLLDFGAARRVLSDRTQALTSIMKPHYAPLEQYADSQSMRQGPWTDLYALGGTMYYLITGEVPVAAASRALHDDQPRLAARRMRDCSPGLLAAIDWMLALKPAERPQSVHMLRDVLEGRITLPGRQAADKTAPGVAARAVPTDIDLSSRHDDEDAAEPALDSAAAVTVLQAQTASPVAAAPPKPTAPITEPQPWPAAASAPPAALAAPADRLVPSQHSAAPLWVLAALLMANLIAWWWFTRAPAGTRVPAQPAAAAALASPAQPAEAAAPASPPPSTRAALAEPPMAADPAASETILSILPARAAVTRAAPTATAMAPRQASAAAPRPRPAVDAAVSTAAVATTGAAAAAGPRERCGDRMFLTMLICIKRECEQPAMQAHPECVKMREQEAAQRDRRQ